MILLESAMWTEIYYILYAIKSQVAQTELLSFSVLQNVECWVENVKKAEVSI